MVTWSKLIKGDSTYQSANNQCKMKNSADDVIQWQLPTSKQAKSFYKHAVRTNLVNNAGWDLGSIWTSTKGTGYNHQVMNLKVGTISWAGVPDVDGEGKYLACVALPQGFDPMGNYFDGRAMWSKIPSDNFTREKAAIMCANMEPAGIWKLPTYDQLYGLADTLIFRTALTKEMVARGWTLGMTFSLGNSIALGVVANAPTKGFVTCVHS
jgi:hypothetical protein